ncbi:Ohr family peroxiredoxin [Streptomyces sp. NBC_01565]|uniref:Ohr family peroxiredoxin n=1 Tax=unclassified Streptomyces TaxID=2593676 RepID=UPI002254BF7B|nr:Ohr family peroxiredoxin [Streptomyces sp. NBC_01565]MCX4545421.1 Ohr family peroxiredoxin [Streptomyces sp. NBC_01565]
MTVPLTQTLYTATAHASGGRTGTVATDDGRLNLQLAPPRKKTPSATNPEQLFAAGYAACFTSALAEVAGEAGVDATAARVTCEVRLGTTDTPGGYGLAVTLTVSVPGRSAAELEPLLHRADATCPYSQAVRGNIPLTLVAVDHPAGQ